MESLVGGFQLPLQRRLTKMYLETKNSYDFVKATVTAAEDPELLTLHRKLRIQKDRLVSWGLGWSESSQSPDIDESLSKAGLGDLVGNVMSTIKEILAEAEPLWKSSRRGFETRRGSSEKSGDLKVPLVTWDRSRFEDLIRDLTISIDTLYDLSRARQTVRSVPSAKQQSSPSNVTSQEPGSGRLFPPTRMQTPQQIDPSALIEPKDMKFNYPVSGGKAFTASLLLNTSNTRQIVYMRRPSSATNPWKLDGPPPTIPVLLEYAPYDPIFSTTGISPSLSRFEKLFAGLQIGHDIERPDFGVLNLIGYFEDTPHSRYGLLYELPSRFGTLGGDPQSGTTPNMATLSDMLSNRSFEPPLEVKFRLAYNLASSVFDMHSKGIVHGNLAAMNVTFFEQPSAQSSENPLSFVNVRRPFLTSFDLFPENASRQVTEPVDETSWYRHPFDPRLTPHTVLTVENRSLDVYSLAMLLLEIGLWSPSRDLVSENAGIPVEPRTTYKQLAARCGTGYLRAVQACWRAIDDDMATLSRPDVALQKLYGRVLSTLERCCSIDDTMDEESSDEAPSISLSADLSKLDERDRASFILSNVIKARDDQYKNKAARSPARGVTRSNISNDAPKSPQNTERGIIDGGNEQLHPPSSLELKPEPTIIPQPKRRFPNNKIAQEHLDFWHAVLMPQINHALRGFYRKYPESVEISLESVGEIASKAKPTILVICTSVGKVRAVLKKYFSYDSSTYALLVCKGKIVRSRNNRPRRSMADDMEPSNAHYQERPLNGASIGAYAEGQHLPPVSFGGLIMVDGKPYGLTVHHMLDLQGAVDDESESSAISRSTLDTQREESGEGPESAFDDEDLHYPISDDGSDTSSTVSSIDDDEPLEDSGPGDHGDIGGIEVGCSEGYYVTQPALDDVEDEFLPSDDSRDEDHLNSHTLGEVYASSGIRRRHENGLTHEIDWALFEFLKDRLPSGNYIQNGEQHCRVRSPYPVDYMPLSSLSGLDVHCMARTSGLQTGRISPGMTIVKIYGRQTSSQSYQISGGLGVPGDSGAWVIDNVYGRACGHVLAWSTRKQVAYFCPMDILLADIAETLNAESVCFPDSTMARNEGLESMEEDDTILTGQKSFLDDNPPTPLLSQSIQVRNVKPGLEPTFAFASSSDDSLVAAMKSMHMAPSVVG